MNSLASLFWKYRNCVEALQAGQRSRDELILSLARSNGFRITPS